jgi:hypothetical protein
MHMNRALIGTVTAVAALAAAGCADAPSEADYGNSVKQMVEAQTYDPAASANPPEQPPLASDGARLDNALAVYRADVAKAAAVKREAEFSVGDKK